jgi:hypothetical protein
MQWLAAAAYPKLPGLTCTKSRLSARFQNLSVYGRTLASRPVNRKRVQRLMRLIGLEPLGPKPKTSSRQCGTGSTRNLPCGLAIDQSNQVYPADITKASSGNKRAI